jgi:hypothetical protein
MGRPPCVCIDADADIRSEKLPLKVVVTPFDGRAVRMHAVSPRFDIPREPP